jgi:hypothetical protein
MSKMQLMGQAAVRFMCPGCKDYHTFFYNGRRHPVSGATWKFDGNLDCPTVSPSLNLAWGNQADEKWEQSEGEPPPNGWSGRCHSIITSGKISFCGDCTHHLVGQTVDLPELG